MTMIINFKEWVRAARGRERTRAEGLLVELRTMQQVRIQTLKSLSQLQKLKAQNLEQQERFEEALLGLSVDLEMECEEILWEYHEALRNGGV